jgi:hypothetical protein
VLEIRPDVPINKGIAIAGLIRSAHRRRSVWR